MFKIPSTVRGRGRTIGSALAIAALALVLSPDRADAHFILRAPSSWMSQDALGDPQKQGPCGTGAGATETGRVTAFLVGQTITVTITETIFHPGHYRIALAVNDRSELPDEPIVSPGMGTPCGSVPIDPAPVFPVLADGVFVHTTQMTGPQSVTVTLPPGVTCDHCTLQVIEFMSNHPLNNPGGCFYHHCADISIQTVLVDAGMPDDAPVDAGTTVDAGATTMDATVADAGTTTNRGCGCAVPGAERSARRFGIAALATTVAAFVVSRRRRRFRGRIVI